MADALRDRDEMLRHLRPELRPGRWVFVVSEDPELAAQARGFFHEDEGLTLIVPEASARDAGLATDLPMRQITLAVESALNGVGLTAAVAEALARYGIPCNVVAAFHHDHIFVPADRAQDALAVLETLQRKADD
ncbi:hypothetical protein OCH239_06715 [Roseivivax halodurans JCM 10272]|uniref:DUF2241 domain-containing protein n=1 Tax=Roseivivax halodurans JCM 10272 TaxID=1449350 RepID=X7ECZ5_9RHOB|nr:ACT domain-containing protein [Roseivivax halodurans]ETX13755.1 hypothetical protein OCH239_06715 [Roseivivax halodurans JCM 10272]